MPDSEAEIIGLLSELMGVEPEELRPERAIEDIVGWDSIAWISLVEHADQRWNVSIRTNEIRRFATVLDLTRHLLTLSKKREA